MSNINEEEELRKLKQEYKEIHNKISEIEMHLRDAGTWWVLYVPDYTGKALTCDKCWDGINQDKNKCKPCPSYKQRFLMTASDISKINDKFIHASR